MSYQPVSLSLYPAPGCSRCNTRWSLVFGLLSDDHKVTYYQDFIRTDDPDTMADLMKFIHLWSDLRKYGGFFVDVPIAYNWDESCFYAPEVVADIYFEDFFGLYCFPD